MASFSIGLDFGTNSVRALVVDCLSGEEVSHFVHPYARGKEGIFSSGDDPNLARQSPIDYFEGTLASIKGALSAAEISHQSFDRSDVIAIGVDTTGSSPMPTNSAGMPLGCLPEFESNLDAQCWLWKDHTSFAEAAEITETAIKMGRPFLDYCGGTYSSEWFWSKILHCARVAPEVFAQAHSWIELQDLIPAYLTDTLASPVRGICAAGHKAMYHERWHGLPDAEFLTALDPRLAELRPRLYSKTQTADKPAGSLSSELARSLGLSTNVQVATGIMDAHSGAIGSGIQPGTLVKIMGTSTCDLMLGDAATPQIKGVCGTVPGSILPDMIGVEAGQSAVGDLFEWAKTIAGMSHEELNREAAKQKPGESGLLALDWNNGNRTILVDPQLSGLIVGQSLQTTVVDIYRAMIEATAFGALKIIRQIEEHGVKIDRIVTGGGIAEKSPLTMQIYADVCQKPIEISGSSQTCALGSAILASVVGGAHTNVAEAVKKMASPTTKTYHPDPGSAKVYSRLFALYEKLHDSYGRSDTNASLYPVMKELIKIRTEARSS